MTNVHPERDTHMAAKNIDSAIKMELDDKVAKATEPKVKRTMLTSEQKIAKAEADLAELRKKAEAKVDKARAEAFDKRTKLAEKRDALNAQIDALTVTIGDGFELDLEVETTEADAA